MKRINFLLTVGLIVSLMVYAGCGGSSDPIPDTASQIQLAKLLGTWNATANSVTRDGAADASYDNFTLTLGGSNNADNTNVNGTSTTNDMTGTYPSGTWEFNGSNVSSIIRDGVNSGKVTMTINSLTDTNLVLTFTLNVDGSGNRTAGLTGAWVFTLTKQ